MEGMREVDTEWSRGANTLLEVLGNDRLWVDRVGAVRRVDRVGAVRRVDRVGAVRRVDRVDCMLDWMRTGF